MLVHLFLATAGWRLSLVGQHAFRQTQTALTSYWMLRGSPFLAYETPVFGPPWSIPFEFPLYQSLVAAWSRLSGMALDQSGRTVSLAFFYMVPLLIVWLTRKLRLPVMTAVLFAVLYLTSPLYLFWSRAFLIETTAMALSLAYLAAAAAGVKTGRMPLLIGAALLGSLAGVVKVTTFAGALASVCVFGLACIWRDRPPAREIVRFASLALAFPLLPTLWWTRFADAVKIQNPLQHMLSGELTAWTFGQPGLRFTRAFWSVLFHRRFPDLLGDLWLPVLAIALCAAVYQRRKIPAFAVAAVFGYWAATLVFAPLHYIHSYYPCGAAAYLYLGLAVLGGALWPSSRPKQLVFAALSVMLAAGNLAEYRREYRPSVFPPPHPFLAVAQFVKAHTSPPDVILIYGNSWNPIIPYYGERRAIMDTLYRPLDSPEMAQSIAGLRPGQRITAVVACLKAREGWYATLVAGSAARLGMAAAWSFDNGKCRVFLARPEAPPPAAPPNVDLARADALLSKIAEKRSSALAGPLGPNPLFEGLNWRLLSGSPFPPAPMEDPGGQPAILADPDTRLSVAVPSSASGVHLEFGIGDYAWKTGHTPAVDFAVMAVRSAGAGLQLWSRPLAPGIRRSDRGEQSVTLKLPEGTDALILTTTSVSRTPAHRAYWSGVRFQAAR